jgi:hypothetical protein
MLCAATRAWYLPAWVNIAIPFTSLTHTPSVARIDSSTSMPLPLIAMPSCSKPAPALARRPVATSSLSPCTTPPRPMQPRPARSAPPCPQVQLDPRRSASCPAASAAASRAGAPPGHVHDRDPRPQRAKNWASLQPTGRRRARSCVCGSRACGGLAVRPVPISSRPDRRDGKMVAITSRSADLHRRDGHDARPHHAAPPHQLGVSTPTTWPGGVVPAAGDRVAVEEQRRR